MMLTRRAALALALGAAALPRSARGQELTAIRLGTAPTDSITPALYALEAGIYKRNGLAATIERQNSGSATLAAVVGGAFQFGDASIMPLIAAHSRGVPIVLVMPAGIYPVKSQDGLIVKTDSPIKSGVDLNGKKIGVSSLSSLSVLGLLAWVDSHGGDSSSLKLVELPQGAIADAVTAGRIDAGIAINPFLDRALATNQMRDIGDITTAVAPRFIGDAWCTMRKFVEDQPGVVQRFHASMQEAVAYCNAHHAETVPLIAQFTGVEPSIISRYPRPLWGTSLDTSLLQPTIDLAAKYKQISAPFNARDFIISA